ncbi:hypothetical protein MLD38_028382 [Melastoma candidum]|uniref:Uncharacterized protein n=1 Tax=Melastoma candidum TaxID=119954 RepID=A0ACB9N0V7_9MYRT|nr:hypothetical protein MLD38_028382 [Melastoma candidum]
MQEHTITIDENVAMEIINHRSLRHPNIIRFKDVVVLMPTHLAIGMEYAAGGELFDQICTVGRLSEDEARYFFHGNSKAAIFIMFSLLNNRFLNVFHSKYVTEI